MGTLYGIGVGPGDPGYVTVRGRQILEDVDVVFYPASKNKPRALSAVLPYIGDKETIALDFPMTGPSDKALETKWKENAGLIKEVLKDRDAAFVVLGDPYLYSTYSYVVEILENFGIGVVTVPGISSVGAIASLLDIPLAQGEEKLVIFPMTGDENELKKVLLENENVVILKVSAGPEILYKVLKDNKAAFDFYMVSDVTAEAQNVSKNPEDLLKKVPYMSTVVLKKKK